jgi:hypothetical protein
MNSRPEHGTTIPEGEPWHKAGENSLSLSCCGLTGGGKRPREAIYIETGSLTNK